jgi:uncharacterized protein (TIGR02118 family)
VKLVAIFATPNNEEAFEKAYFEEHVPLIRKVPGLEGIEVNKLTRTLVGFKSPYMIATMTFTDKEALKAGMNSPEMAAAGENLDSFAKDRYTLCFAEEK